MTVVNPVTSATEMLRRSPLASRHAEFTRRSNTGPRGVRLSEEPFLTQVNLRMAPRRPALLRVEHALGLALPVDFPNHAYGSEDRAVVWLGPDEWLLVAPDGEAEHLIQAVGGALEKDVKSIVDVSANRTTLRLAGAHAREVLEKVCTLDLHPRSFGPGRCAQTLVGRTQAVLWQVSAEPAYRLMVRCSFSHYLADLLLDAMTEFSE